MTFDFALGIAYRHSSGKMQKIALGHQAPTPNQQQSRLQKAHKFHPTTIFDIQNPFFFFFLVPWGGQQQLQGFY